MRKVVAIILVASIAGCAKVNLQTEKPLRAKIDINMRVDVYQHVQQKIDEIEDIVTGSEDQDDSSNTQNLYKFFIQHAYAGEKLSPEVEAAALRRKERYGDVRVLLQQRLIGENRLGLLELRDSSKGNISAQEILKEENADRMIIYKALAQENGVSVEDIQSVYAQQLQKEAPTGAPIEILSKAGTSYMWRLR